MLREVVGEVCGLEAGPEEIGYRSVEVRFPCGVNLPGLDLRSRVTIRWEDPLGDATEKIKRVLKTCGFGEATVRACGRQIVVDLPESPTVDQLPDWTQPTLPSERMEASDNEVG